jgi:hypothetical protein
MKGYGDELPGADVSGTSASSDFTSPMFSHADTDHDGPADIFEPATIPDTDTHHDGPADTPRSDL